MFKKHTEPVPKGEVNPLPVHIPSVESLGFNPLDLLKFEFSHIVRDKHLDEYIKGGGK